jgi:hypothetical protein
LFVAARAATLAQYIQAAIRSVKCKFCDYRTGVNVR